MKEQDLSIISEWVLLRKKSSGFLGLLGLSSLLLLVLGLTVYYLFTRGVGVFGINIPVVWGFDITNFVWWIGIGHAGTFISAFLLLMRQNWRSSINRFAEAMTLFAVTCAGLFPVLHLGRPQYLYWLLPYPDTMGTWPQWRSPLVWDVFAVTTYFLVSLLFWYVGLIPDLAVLRDQTTSRLKQFLYGIFALGWRGSVRHWEHYQVVYLLLAGLATALVVSVHSVVSLDFTASIVPGWHSTIFPPYFVAGAIFSGFAMVLTIAVPLRTYFGFKHLITEAHLDKAAKLILVTGLIVAYSYVMEGFTAWYSNSSFEKFTWVNRALGPYAPLFWLLLVCNVALPQFFWSAKCRKNGAILLSVSLGIQLGMWAERFVIIVTSLHRNVMPSRWGMYYPTVWDWGALLGSIGLFGFAFLLFLAFIPAISISEMRKLLSEEKSDANTNK
ncbi:MAG: hydrogenase [Bdellovibrionales bacterium GWB1_52_6]|nr:MAG: hydrogenase [Bdellovibrionales bacterium GWB1_52_6]OFZ06362.1 MAG: hydrogenase [Bdellovibrionales bacterium GWA1_52_35]HCM40115.1 hydrogenase [Bdellovibrionales bacterium]